MSSFNEWCQRNSGDGNATIQESYGNGTQTCDGQTTWACVNNRLHDKDLLQSLQISPILGIGCLLLFGILNSRIILFRIRLVLSQVTVKPPSLPSSGLSVLWSWLYRAIVTSDQHLLASAGLDALVLVKTMGFGVQLFVPLTLVASFVLIPIHQKGGFLKSNSGRYMDMTLSNVQPSSDIYWVHFVCVYAFICYALALLYFQNQRFTKMRHHYLTVGDDPDVCHSRILATCQSYTSEATTVSQEKPLSKQAKVTRLMKMVTGLGDFDEPQNVRPRMGLMARSSMVRQDADGKLLHDLEDRKGNLIKRHSFDGSSGQTGSSSSPGRQNLAKISSKSMEPSRQPPQSLFARAAKEIAKASVRVPALQKWWHRDFDGLQPKNSATGDNVGGRANQRLASTPSIRSLRTVIATDDMLGEDVAVNAQQYCVLITNVPDVQLMISKRKAKMTVTKKKGLLRVWDFLYRWIGGGFSLKTFHPSAQTETSLKRLERSAVAPSAVLGVSFRGDDKLMEDDEENYLKDNAQARWDELAKKVYSEEIFHIEEALVEESFKSLFSSDFVKAVPIRDPQAVDKLLFVWERYTARLEVAEEYLERTGNRKQFIVWTWAAVLSILRGKFSLERRDEIAFCEDKIRRLEEKISSAQKKIMRSKPSSSWILIFRTQYAATIAAQTLLHSEATHKFKAYPAPGPEEMNWHALCKSWIEKDIRSVLVFPFLAFMCLLPIGLAMGAMTKLNYFLCSDFEADWYWPAYCQTDGTSGTNRLRSLVTGWLPSIVVAIWQNVVMPKTLYYLLQVQSTCFSLSQLDREIASVFFYWDVFNIFLGGMMGGTLFTADLLCSFENSSDILRILGASVPASANFFVNYVTLRAFFLVPCQFLAPHPGIWIWALKLGGSLGIARTKRTKTALYRPSSIRYGREYGIVLLIFLISICYSVVAPVIVPIALIFFIVSWLTWRYQVLYVFVRKYESGGRMWPVFFHRILYCLFLFQFFTSCVLMFKKAVIQAIILFITVPIILIKFTSHCHNKFRAGMDYIPLEMAFHAPAADVDPLVYTPPGLVRGCPSWHPEYMKAWEGWGAPTSNI